MAKLRLVLESDVLSPASVVGIALGQRFRIHGAGSPLGQVVAPPGATYRDDTAALGAIEWVKTVGTDEDGWQVSVGDTGWRNVAPDAGSSTNHPGLKVYLRRVGSTVYAQVIDSTPAAAGTGLTVACTLPAGFAKGDTITAVTGQVMDNATGGPAAAANLYVSAANEIRVFRAGALLHMGSLSWPTTAPWPTVLPGTAL